MMADSNLVALQMLLQYVPRKRDFININYAGKRLNTVVRFHFSIYEITGPKNEDGIISYTIMYLIYLVAM